MASGFKTVLHALKEALVELTWVFFISPIFDNAKVSCQVVVPIVDCGNPMTSKMVD